MPRAVGLGRAEHFSQSCPFLCPGGGGVGSFARGGRVWLGRHRAAGRAKRGRAPPCRTGLRRSPVLPTQCASERTLFFVLKSVQDAACGGVGPGGAFYSKLPFSFPGRCWGPGSLGAGWPRHRPPPHAAFRTRCPRTVQRVRSEAHDAAAVPRLARSASGGGPGKTGKSAALPRRAEAEPGPPHAVRIRTDTFLCPEKCPGCRVRWGWAGRSVFLKAALSFARAALGPGQFGRGAAAPLSAAARDVSDTLPSYRAACSLRGALRGGSAASGSAGIGRRAGQSGEERRPASPG